MVYSQKCLIEIGDDGKIVLSHNPLLKYPNEIASKPKTYVFNDKQGWVYCYVILVKSL